MKLVQILARELGEWPTLAKCAEQDNDKEVRFIGGPTIFDFFASRLADEDKDISCADGIPYAGPVTRADWEAERAKLAKPQEVKWIRHRGGRCPVEDGTLIDVRYRDGEIKLALPANENAKGHERDAGPAFFRHGNAKNDIMAYRLHKPEQQTTKVSELTIEVTTNTEGVREVIEDMQMQIDQIDGPIKWRDRITEIDATTQALATERADLVQKLASEGFSLIGRAEEVLQPVEGMSDWRNWRRGDLIEVSGDSCAIDGIFSVDIIERDADDSMPVRLNGCGWPEITSMKFHSRP